jgi:hypothetical protein
MVAQPALALSTAPRGCIDYFVISGLPVIWDFEKSTAHELTNGPV